MKNLTALVLTGDSCRACKQVVDTGVVATVANTVSFGCSAVASGSTFRCRLVVALYWRFAQQASGVSKYVQIKVCRGWTGLYNTRSRVTSPPESSRRLVRTRGDSCGLSRTQVSALVGNRDVWKGLTKRRYDSRVVAKLRHYSRTRCREAPRGHFVAATRDSSRLRRPRT